eukprot:GHVS01086273.1.p1 GENE.GHVS01086273.1~~GHVS01086273.1.p1  ORF type:complete len:685 (-),score=54.39 GHVS01086273.1:544-2598(-)
MLLYHLHGVMLLVGLLVGRSSLVVAGEGDLKHLKFMGAGRLLEGSEEDCKNIHKSTFKLFKTHDSWGEHERLKIHKNGEAFAFGDGDVGIIWKNSVLIKGTNGIRAVINDQLPEGAKKIIRSTRPLMFTLSGVCKAEAVPEVLHTLVGCDICLVTNTSESDVYDDIRTIINSLLSKEATWAFRLDFKEEFDSVLFRENGRVVGISRYTWGTPLVTLREIGDDEWAEIIRHNTVSEQEGQFIETKIYRPRGVVSSGLFIMSSHRVAAYVLWFDDGPAGSHYEIILPHNRDSTDDVRLQQMKRAMRVIRVRENLGGGRGGHMNRLFRVRCSGEFQRLQDDLAALLLGDIGLLVVDYLELYALSTKGTDWQKIIDLVKQGDDKLGYRIAFDKNPPDMPSVLLKTVEHSRWGPVLGYRLPAVGDEWLKSSTTGGIQDQFPNQDVELRFVEFEDLRVIIIYMANGTDFGRYEVWFEHQMQELDIYSILIGAVMESIRLHKCPQSEFRHGTDSPKPQFLIVADPPKPFAGLLCQLILHDKGNLLIDGPSMDAIREDDKWTEVLQKPLLDKMKEATQAQFEPATMATQELSQPLYGGHGDKEDIDAKRQTDEQKQISNPAMVTQDPFAAATTTTQDDFETLQAICEDDQRIEVLQAKEATQAQFQPATTTTTQDEFGTVSGMLVWLAGRAM